MNKLNILDLERNFINNLSEWFSTFSVQKHLFRGLLNRFLILTSKYSNVDIFFLHKHIVVLTWDLRIQFENHSLVNLCHIIDEERKTHRG